jgi:hypothetical protein
MMTASLMARPAAAQASASLTITATVRPSVLLSLTGPDRTVVSKGGDDSASVTLILPAGALSLSFSSLARVANNPLSPGYRLIARLGEGHAPVMVDNIGLRAQGLMIADHLPYDAPQGHTVTFSVVSDAPVSLVLTCIPL